MQMKKSATIIETHLKSFFPKHELTLEQWKKGPVETLKILSRLRVAKLKPPAKMEPNCAYCTIGTWELGDEKSSGFEFMMLTPFETPRATELLTMSANYHRAHHLGFGHRFPIGEGWLEGSKCDHFLVSLPYTVGSDFEICQVSDDHHIHIAWLLPITKAENDFARSNGVEALEQKFESIGLEYWNPQRKSVI